jgi:hypothetical protein
LTNIFECDGRIIESAASNEVAFEAALSPIINQATVKRRKLIVSGQNFDSGAKILLNGVEQSTKYKSITKLVGKNVGQVIRPNDKIKVRNSDGTESTEYTYRP